jgi:hypothetical protein
MQGRVKEGLKGEIILGRRSFVKIRGALICTYYSIYAQWPRRKILPRGADMYDTVLIACLARRTITAERDVRVYIVDATGIDI